jgi:hypothetical protein
MLLRAADQRLNLAINAGLADPRLKARLDEIGLFDERDLATITSPDLNSRS